MKLRASALSHLERYPGARPSTISNLIARDRMNDQLRAEVARINRQKRIDAIKRAFWTVWRR